MVSATRQPFHPLLIAALFLSPVAGAASLATGSVILGIAVAAFAWAAWNWPEEILLGLVLTAPLVRSGNAALLSPLMIAQAKTAAALLLGVIWWGRMAVSRRESLFPRWLVVFLIVWTTWTGLVMLHSADVGRSLEYLSMTAAGVAIFGVSFHLSARDQRRVLWLALVLGGMIGCIVALQYAIVVHHVAGFLERFIVEPRTQAYFDSNLSPMEPARYRPTGTMSHPNAMGLYFAMLIPFAFALMRVRGFRLRERALLVAAAGFMGCGLYATNSRAAIVFLIVALLYLATHRGYRWFWGVAAGVVLAGSLFITLSSSGPALLDELVSKARVEAGLSGRDTIWKNSWDLARHAWVLGVGPGNFSQEYVSHFGYFVPHDVSEQSGQIWAIQMLGDQVINNFHAHNMYLQLLGEAGIGGPLLLLAGILAALFFTESASRRQPLGSYRRAIALATAANAAGLLCYGFFDSQLGFTVGSLNLVAAALLAFGLKPRTREFVYG